MTEALAGPDLSEVWAAEAAADDEIHLIVPRLMVPAWREVYTAPAEQDLRAGLPVLAQRAREESSRLGRDHPAARRWAYAVELAAELLDPDSGEPQRARPWLTLTARGGQPADEQAGPAIDESKLINCAWPGCHEGKDGGPRRFIPRSKRHRYCRVLHRTKAFDDRRAAEQGRPWRRR